MNELTHSQPSSLGRWVSGFCGAVIATLLLGSGDFGGAIIAAPPFGLGDFRAGAVIATLPLGSADFGGAIGVTPLGSADFGDGCSGSNRPRKNHATASASSVIIA
jgi:hypothetical protein